MHTFGIPTLCCLGDKLDVSSTNEKYNGNETRAESNIILANTSYKSYLNYNFEVVK